MNYTRLFHQRVKTRPWSGLKQLPHWWRSVIHTCLSAKISSNVTFFYLRVQPGFTLSMPAAGFYVSAIRGSWGLDAVVMAVIFQSPSHPNGSC